MDMKDLLSKMAQLNEAKEASYSPSYRVGKTGDFSDKPHTKRGTPVAGKVGKYGKTSDELGDPDQDPDDDTAASPEKRGRGRPKKAGGAADTKDRYSGAKDLQSVMIGKMPKSLPGKKGAVHKSPQDKEEGAVKKKSLKDWVERVEQVIAENTAMPTTTSTATAPNASQKVMVKPGQPAGQKPPATMTTQTGQTIAVGSADQVKKLGDLVNTGQVQLTKPGTTQPLDEEDMEEGAEKWIKGAIKHPGAFTQKAKSHGMTPSSFASKVLSNKEDYPAKTEKQANLAKTLGKFRKQTDEADIPPNDSLMSPISEAKKKADAAAKKDDKAEKAGKKVTKDIEYDEKVKDGIHGKKRGAEDNKAERAGKKVTKDIEYDMKKKTVKEAAKPDFPDIDNDGNTKESMKKAAADKKKKAVKEGRDHHLKAAYHEGKAHGLSKQPYNCRHDDMEEAKQYHEGYKCGLDECYSQQPILGYVGEESQHDVVDTMASYGAHGLEEDDMGEGNAFTGMLAKTPKGGKFSLGNKAFTDTSDIDEMAFESWDKQLSAILEGKKVNEGMTVSISKGQQGSPDSVSVSAQDGEADQLLSLIKSAGLGLFGGDESKGFAPGEGTPSTAPGGIEVVDDHDGMMALMKKLTGGDSSGHDGDYEEEEGHEEHEEHEEQCNECGGMMEAGHSCGSKEMVDEVESEDQMTYNVAEDNPPDSGAAEEEEEIQDTAQANSSAAAFDQSQSNDIDEGAGGPEASEEPVEPIVSESSFFNLYKKLAMLSEESTAEKDEKAEKAGKKVAKDIEYDEGHKGKDDNKAEKAGKKVTKDIEYDDKKDKKLDEWANQVGGGPGKGTDAGFEQDIAFMTKVISGGLNKQKSTGQTTIPVVANQGLRTGVNENLVADWKKLAGIK